MLLFMETANLVVCRPPRGGRGLKYYRGQGWHEIRQSPPSRGAWIEITVCEVIAQSLMVSPPSRGAWIEIVLVQGISISGSGRPPRGGRGLKSHSRPPDRGYRQSPPSRGAWIEISSHPWR